MDDHFNSSRINEEDVFALVRRPGEDDFEFFNESDAVLEEEQVRRPEEDGSEFLNESGPGMEEEQRDEAQTSIECDEDWQLDGHPQVYEASIDQMQ